MSARISAAAVGLHAGPFTTTVDARWLMAYAAGLGETDPRYFDTLHPAGPAAHPLFAVCVEWPPLVALRAKIVPEELAPRGVHARHHLVLGRAPRAGDTLCTTARVTGVESRRAGALVTVRLDTIDGRGERVATTRYGSVYRGVAVDGTVAGDPEPPTRAVMGEVEWTEEVTVSASAAHVYTECSRVWNPIHTDVAVARAAGLPALILHGTATLGLAVSRVIRRHAGGDPAAVTAVAARFTGMVPLPSTFRVRGRGRRGDVVAFDAVGGDGVTLLADGAVGLAP